MDWVTLLLYQNLTKDKITALRKVQKFERFQRRRFVKATILLRFHQGLSIKDIELSLGINESTIRYYLKGFLTKPFDDYLKLIPFRNGHSKYMSYNSYIAIVTNIIKHEKKPIWC